MANKVGGRIVKIKLKGFMTYDDLEIKPNKGLNLIIGLNGSGKSSIMAAICLGLGGKPTFTGRAVQLTDFIKYNHTKAVIEIELESSRGKNDIIRRIIQADKSPSWYLNNKHASQNEITAIMKKYNIDMGNLCQFLPQEKVAEFSKMDKKQRLMNMIQAIGDSSLVSLFDELKTLRKEFCYLAKTLEELDNTKISEQKINERLKPDIEKQEERIKLQKQLQVLHIRKKAFDFQYLSEKLNKVIDEKKRLNEELSTKEEVFDQLQAEKAEFLSELSIYEAKVKELEAKVSRCMQNLTKHYGSLGAYHEDVDNAKINFENKMIEKEEQITKLTAISRQIEGLKGILIEKKDEMEILKKKLEQNTKEYENIKQQLSSCDSEVMRVTLSKNSLEYKKKSKLEEIYRISDEENRKYEVLREKSPDAYTALQWLQQHESSFRARVLPPILVSIKVLNDDYRKYIESSVSDRNLLMFVCEDKEDLERFLKIMKHEKKLSINVSMVPSKSLAEFPSPPITNEMRRLGIECYLKDLFTAPDPVMRVLCQLCQVHQVPVCNENAAQNIVSIVKYSNLFYTPSEKIFGLKSRYGQQHMSIKREVLVAKGILPDIVNNSEDLLTARSNLQEIEKMLAEITPQYDELQKQRTQLERQQEQLRNEKISINNEMRKLNELNVKLGQLNEAYKRRSEEMIDEEAEKKKVADVIRNLNTKKLKILAEIHKIVKEMVHLKKEKATAILFISVFAERMSAVTDKISNLEKDINNLKSQLSEADSKRSRIKSEALKCHHEVEKMKEELQDVPGAVTLNEENLKNLTEQQLLVNFRRILYTIHQFIIEVIKKEKLSDFRNFTLEQVEQLMSNTEAQLELMNEDIAHILVEYKKREQTILDIEEKVNSLKVRIDDLKIQIQEKKEKWLPPLITHIETVNQKFSKYYKMLKCAGEISLDQTDDTDDFPNYGLQIKLKYRVDEEFMELSQTHHSGGECSVAAIIFILSLQEMTDVPFRCIDEINQGMDAVNERKIYQLVADAARSGSCSQYFLLTPKLLMDLSYNKDVAVHIIFNSPFLKGKLDVKEHLKIAKSNRQ
ncbi:Structural maintenance of chromosomes protein 5 like protein [Argiope bruennichi]|uniref:Structural maintenance of chromosomes protein 5 n=1 Tax=Argiope bruennichi TaxID=94029 RepID=A0A8T0FCT6_ARGBR|nr:Structural maintenance of chromosomes protein 5 like protein [Argiope bruennichi]